MFIKCLVDIVQQFVRSKLPRRSSFSTCNTVSCMTKPDTLYFFLISPYIGVKYKEAHYAVCCNCVFHRRVQILRLLQQYLIQKYCFFFYSTYPRMQVRYEDVISFFFTMLFFPHNCLENGIQGY